MTKGPTTLPSWVHSNPVALGHAERIAPTIEDAQEDIGRHIRAVIKKVFEDPDIRKAGKGAVIRYTTMCGEVIRRILAMKEMDPGLINVLAIGDVTLPPEAKTTMDELVEAAHGYERELTAEGYGYDLASQGSLRARGATIDYLDSHYGFSAQEGLRDVLVKNTGVSSGGMRALNDIASSFVLSATRDVGNPSRPRFIQPDNSFGTWRQIAKNASMDGREADIHTINTEQKNLLHLTASQVDDFYASNPHETEDRKYSDLWYITPVGNPSGTRMTPSQLSDVAKAIVRNNPNATIVLDCVYVRTLRKEDANALLKDIISDPTVMDRVLFVESLSKTHGIPGKRVGVYFSKNPDIFGKVLNLNMTVSAGNGYDKDALLLAVANSTPEQEKVFKDLHEFWARERRGLFHYLRQPQFSYLFDEDQSHITPEQMENPLGLYLFMKLESGVTYQDVAIATGCLGVEDKDMGAGTFIRFSVGKITEPTYAKYIPEVEEVGEVGEVT